MYEPNSNNEDCFYLENNTGIKFKNLKEASIISLTKDPYIGHKFLLHPNHCVVLLNPKLIYNTIYNGKMKKALANILNTLTVFLDKNSSDAIIEYIYKIF